MGTMTICLAVCLAVLAMQPSAQASEPATAVSVAKSYGFTDAEIEKVLHGDILTKALKEGSNKELAGVAAVWLPVPVAEFADIALEGKLLKFDSSIRSLNVWKPDESADKAFTDLQVDVAQQAMLKARYEAYRKNGLAGIVPYARGAKNAGSAGELLALAIEETQSLERLPGYAKALLDFPADPLPGMEHRFFAYEQEVEGLPTVILTHRAAARGERHALITEQRYFVSQTYHCRFIASECFEVSGGTLVFYVSRIFTDQVAGFGSRLKHALGRGRMLAKVATNLKRDREQLKK
jgi:hypothetical protein